jgi:hypothetical protein
MKLSDIAKDNRVYLKEDQIEPEEKPSK